MAIPPSPAPSPTYGPVASPARYTVADTGNGAPPPAPTDANQFKDAIAKIENDPNVQAMGGKVDGLLNKQEIQKAISDGDFSGSQKDFWQNVADNFDKLDVQHGAYTGGDGLINAGDLSYNGISYPA